MKLSSLHIRLNGLVETIKNDSVDVSIVEQSNELFERFIADEEFRKKFSAFSDRSVAKVEFAKEISINDDQKITFFLFSAHLRWMKVNLKGPSFPLLGGFTFKHGKAMMMESSDVWKNSHQDFLKFEKSTLEEEKLLSNLIWFESPTSANSSTSTPYYGCVLPNGKSFPHEFYFYDGGLIYPLPFKSYKEYILALIANVGVECWQYFYIEPSQLIQKNRGLNYMTTELRKGTRLVEGLRNYEYNESYDFDRFDLIQEYLKRCVEFLPGAFPTLSFEHQSKYQQKLENLL